MYEVPAIRVNTTKSTYIFTSVMMMHWEAYKSLCMLNYWMFHKNIIKGVIWPTIYTQNPLSVSDVGCCLVQGSNSGGSVIETCSIGVDAEAYDTTWAQVVAYVSVLMLLCSWLHIWSDYSEFSFDNCLAEEETFVALRIVFLLMIFLWFVCY